MIGVLDQPFMHPSQRAINQVNQAMDPAGCMHDRYMRERDVVPGLLRPSHGESWRDREYRDTFPLLIKPEPIFVPEYKPLKLVAPKLTAFDFMYDSAVSNQRKQKEEDEVARDIYGHRRSLGLI